MALKGGSRPIRIGINPHGIVGVAVIALMIGIAYVKEWDIDWLYFVLAIVAYAITVGSLTVAVESETDPSDRFLLFRWLLGSHFALLLLAGGILLNWDGFFVQTGIFLAAVALGLALPFMFLREQV